MQGINLLKTLLPINSMKRNMYYAYKEFYGYVFYIGKKI